MPLKQESRSLHQQFLRVQWTRHQTVIIFDWDDTLFPTTYVRHDLGLNIQQPLKNQKLKAQMMARVQTTLGAAAGAACSLVLTAR